jgi:hypothetical protein
LPLQRGNVPKTVPVRFTHLYLISLSVGPTGPTQKVFFGKFSLPFTFFVPPSRTDPDPEKLYGSATLFLTDQKATCGYSEYPIGGKDHKRDTLANFSKLNKF